MLRLSKGKVFQHFRGSRGIQPVAEFLASPKEDRRFLGDIDGRACPRLAGEPRRPLPDPCGPHCICERSMPFTRTFISGVTSIR